MLLVTFLGIWWLLKALSCLAVQVRGSMVRKVLLLSQVIWWITLKRMMLLLYSISAMSLQGWLKWHLTLMGRLNLEKRTIVFILGCNLCLNLEMIRSRLLFKVYGKILLLIGQFLLIPVSTIFWILWVL
jgi:hypothetical protein